MDRKFENLIVWQKSKDLIVDIYELLYKFPESEKYAMSSQIRRAVNSVCANIAEGSGRNTDKDFIHFLFMSKGSLEETKSFLYIANELGYINKDDLNRFIDRINEVGKILGGLIKSLNNSTNTYIK
ncbi:MAG: four helix bundle protein [Eubacteriaceae bacterium]|nr:four helix bundle protein [Eubacteriaceae bacterium]